MQKKAIIAMSGGVDSSVAAYLMVKDGYDCAGITLGSMSLPLMNGELPVYFHQQDIVSPL